jgi:hypothetical protein
MLPALLQLSVRSSRLLIENGNEMGNIVSMHGENKKYIEKYALQKSTEIYCLPD